MNTHLDEDVCAAGGLIARTAERGAPIHVLALTDSDRASAAHRHAARPGELNRRLANQRLAYERLGARHARHDALALGSGQAGLWVLAPRREDPHPDHAAAGTAAAQACQAYRVGLIEYLPTGWPNSTAVPASAHSLARSPVLGIRKRHAIAATMPRGVPTRWTPDELYLAGGCPARVSPRASRRS